MKNKIKYTTIALAATILFGCSDWLDVSPRSQKKSADLFQYEDGFQSALAGVYLIMMDESIYGLNSTMQIPEFMARNWYVDSDTRYYYSMLATFAYNESEIEGVFSNMWLTYYKAIAQLNDIEENLNKNPDVLFSNDNRRILEGETLGLRAFIHLDVLRFFGPVPKTANTSESAIPYVNEVSNDASTLISIPYGEVLNKIKQDLDRAEELLADVDPIITLSNTALNTLNHADAPEDEWLHYRQYRFNYYAVLAAKARYYLWIDNKEEAAKYAKMVIDAVNSDGTAKFPMANSDYFNQSSVDLTIFQEHVFSLKITDLENRGNRLFNMQDGTPVYLSSTRSQQLLATLYDGVNNPEDLRWNNLRDGGTGRYYWVIDNSNVDRRYYFNKFSRRGSSVATSPVSMPLLRITEMYLILAESLPTTTGKEYFNSYMTQRKMNPDKTPTITQTVIENEYRKEFLAEGQMFFFYKRNNYPKFTWPKEYTLPSGNPYVVPRPLDQISFE